MTREQKRISTKHVAFEVDDLFDKLISAAQVAKATPILVHVSWHGCSGCLGPLEAALLRLEANGFPLIEVPWRTENGNFAYDYAYRITAVYRVWEQIVLGKMQRLGGFQEVETYPVPPWDRPHFPQVFLLDNTAIDMNAIQNLKKIHNNGDLVNNGNEVKEFTKAQYDDTSDFTVRDLLRNVIASQGVLFQMVNEHLFQINDDILQEDALIETVDCAQAHVSSTPPPGICVKYHGRYPAKRIWRG